mmetsp:Transcript_21539/g.52044  ORF Transcript_21539/g.52044 Transcript_21539/m.52044 type:complete len:276 (+) Transcript_21539:3972-4799(+)
MLLLCRSPQQLVEDVVVSLPGPVVPDANLLEEVRLHLRALEHPRAVESQLDELPEPGRVVVPERLGVTERLKDGVGLQDALHDAQLLTALAPPLDGVLREGAAQRGEVEHDDLGGFRLSCAGLAADEDALGLALLGHHLAVGSIGDGVDVGREGFGVGVAEVLGAQEALLPVGFEDFRGIKRQPLKRIHRNEHRSRPRVNLPPKVPLAHGVQYRRLVQVLQRDHIVVGPLLYIGVAEGGVRELDALVLGAGVGIVFFVGDEGSLEGYCVVGGDVL